MRLSEILSIDRTTTALVARDKDEALAAVADLFPGVDATQARRVLREREALASTGVGSGVAIPHGRLPGLEELQAALAICPSGVDFDAVDGDPVRILVAILAPEHKTGEHLKALARVSRLLRSDAVRRALISASSPAEALSIALDNDRG